MIWLKKRIIENILAFYQTINNDIHYSHIIQTSVGELDPKSGPF